MNSNQVLKEHLNNFWLSLGGNKNTGAGISEKLKLEKLIRMSEVVIQYKEQSSLGYRREKFNKVKFFRHSLKSHHKCFICTNLADVRHHIVLLKNGGINSKRNLVSLCNNCHGKIHNWL